MMLLEQTLERLIPLWCFNSSSESGGKKEEKEEETDSKNTSPNPWLFGELVDESETKISLDTWLSKCFNRLFTWEERKGAGASPCIEAVPDEEAHFSGAMAQDEKEEERKMLNNKI